MAGSNSGGNQISTVVDPGPGESVSPGRDVVVGVGVISGMGTSFSTGGGEHATRIRAVRIIKIQICFLNIMFSSIKVNISRDMVNKFVGEI